MFGLAHSCFIGLPDPKAEFDSKEMVNMGIVVWRQGVVAGGGVPSEHFGVGGGGTGSEK